MAIKRGRKKITDPNEMRVAVRIWVKQKHVSALKRDLISIEKKYKTLA